MREDNVCRRPVEVTRQKVGQIFIRQVPVSRCDPLLELPCINGTCAKHVTAVIRFDDDRCAAFELFFDQLGKASEVHKRRDLYSTLTCDEPEIVDRVVRNAEWVEV